MGKCKFNPEWIKIKEYSLWLEAVRKNVYQFSCIFCNRQISCQSGMQSLDQHLKSEIHKLNESKNKVSFFINFKKKKFKKKLFMFIL